MDSLRKISNRQNRKIKVLHFANKICKIKRMKTNRGKQDPIFVIKLN